ncbi:adenine deaminase [Alkalicoccus daliensis]|uniref:Adenine deaminase n=1 Tax=Alkalicoccus daliensis TaxID=745820 RepID=A0A1H0DZS4_9BACI|nr:adenine deaminase [Alkalicoccus daliensis]SDN75536.1 Adenine deaminase [Alkalicoccus daliensis]
MEKDIMKRLIKTADKKEKAEFVFKNAKVVNVFTKEVETLDVGITAGKIAGLGSYEGKEEVEMEGRYLLPGFIDGHVHIESSMVSPSRFADVVVPKGVTTIVTDPHEIANVKGSEGIQYMLDDSEEGPLNAYFMLPSCVPATPFENAGAVLTAEDLRPFYQHPRVIGLAEVMDYPSVAGTSPDMMQKLTDAQRQLANIDGHGAGFDKHQVNLYRAAGITTDHECTTAEEAQDRVRRGMYVIIREGSAAKDLEALLPAVTEANSRRFLFCTDDKHLDALMEEGSIDASVRMAVKQGMDPLTAVQLATINAAECFGLTEKGAVAPGYDADLLIVDNLEKLTVEEVYQQGKIVAQHGNILGGETLQAPVPESLTHTVVIPELKDNTFEINANGKDTALCIDYIPNSIVTKKAEVKLPVKDCRFEASAEKDTMKLAVIERHKNTGNIGLGFIRGLAFKEGAFALTVAHDSHNIVTAGYRDEDMKIAVEKVHEMQGGLVLVKEGSVIASLSLSLAGLMSTGPAAEAVEDLITVEKGFAELGFTGSFNPLSALSFMCLPVIPSLKLTDLGYFDSEIEKHTSV